MLQIAIVEDEKSSAKKLIDYLEKYQKENNHPFQVRWFKDGMDFLHEYNCQYAIVFMDIEMPFMNGMDVARKLREKDKYVCLIFVTNMAQYALQGYEVQASNFLVKPIDYYQFSLVIRKAMEYNDLINAPEILLATQDGYCKVSIQSIKYAEVKNHWIYYHLLNGVKIVRSTMQEAEKKLEKHGFFRCNNCYLVNMRYVSTVKGDFVWVDDEELKMSRSRRKAFMLALTDYLGDIG